MYVSQTPLSTVSLYIQVCTSWGKRLNLLKQLFHLLFVSQYFTICYASPMAISAEVTLTGLSTTQFVNWERIQFIQSFSCYWYLHTLLLQNTLSEPMSLTSYHHSPLSFPAVFLASYPYHFRTSLLSAISVLCCIFFLDKLSWLHPMVFVLMSSKHVLSPSIPLASNSVRIIA